jgi:hypothetical protein
MTQPVHRGASTTGILKKALWRMRTSIGIVITIVYPCKDRAHLLSDTEIAICRWERQLVTSCPIDRITDTGALALRKIRVFA